MSTTSTDIDSLSSVAASSEFEDAQCGFKTYKRQFFFNNLNDFSDEEPAGSNHIHRDNPVCQCAHLHVKCFINKILETGIVDMDTIKRGFMKEKSSDSDKKGKVKSYVINTAISETSSNSSSTNNNFDVISDHESLRSTSPVSDNFQTNDEFSACFEDFHMDNISKLCIDLEHLIAKKTTQTFTAPDPDLITAEQNKFFTNIYGIIQSFSSLNNFLIFKYRDSFLKQDNNTPDYLSLQRFDNFNEFMRKSASLMSWLQTFESANENKASESTLSRINSTNEILNKFKIDSNEHDRLESQLQGIKKQLTQFDEPRTENKTNNGEKLDEITTDKQSVHLPSASVIEAASEPESNSVYANGSCSANRPDSDYDYEKYLKYERLNREYERVLNHFFYLHSILKKINSKEYKIMSMGKYTNLRLQLKAYKRDLKLEQKEKCYWKQKLLQSQVHATNF